MTVRTRTHSSQSVDVLLSSFPQESKTSLPSLSSTTAHFLSFIVYMPFYFQRQGGNLPPILRLPDEILEEIFAEVDQHSDLVAFALTSRTSAALVIPHHTQYRLLRVRHTHPDMWAHLARRADLARNIREVHICDEKSKVAPDRYPTVLIDPALDRDLDNAEESVRIRNLSKALGNMRRLHTMKWARNGNNGQRPTSHPNHENAVLTAVNSLPELKHVSLCGRFGLHALNSTRDPESLTYPAWMLANLRSLTLQGECWARPGNSKHVLHVLANSPNLETLVIPLQVQNIGECKLPKLRKLKLLLDSSGVSIASFNSQSRIQFLKNHPLIEELVYSPPAVGEIPSDILPNLKSLYTNNNFIASLNGDCPQPTSIGLPSPPATPVTSVTPIAPMPEEIVPLVPSAARPIEFLSVSHMADRTILEANFLRPESLRALQLSSVENVSTIYDLPVLFPNIEWLSLSPYYSNQNRADLIAKEEWVNVLPRFKKLQVFRGASLWKSVKDSKQEMHEIIIELAQTCPNLRALDRVNKSRLLDPHNEIIIKREGNHIDYSIEPFRGGPFDSLQSRL